VSSPEQIVPKEVSISKEFISILTILFGTLLVALGCGFAFGWPFGVIAAGVVVLVFGFILGLGK
jgi:hypothetical protein